MTEKQNEWNSNNTWLFGRGRRTSEMKWKLGGVCMWEKIGNEKMDQVYFAVFIEGLGGLESRQIIPTAQVGI